jgi:hypothetical protein
MQENDLKFWLNVFIVVFLFFAFGVFINSIGLQLNAKPPPKKLLQVVTIEGLTNNNNNETKDNTSIIVNKSDAFCQHHTGSSHILENSCGKLTQGNCNTTSCCVWTSNNKCVAGKAKGPTFNTDDNGKTKNLDYYYYQNKCYGSKCP